MHPPSREDSPSHRPSSGAPRFREPRAPAGRPLPPIGGSAFGGVPATIAIIAINAVIFTLEEAWGGSQNTETLVRMGAIYTHMPGSTPPLPWGSIVAASFLHFGLLHIAMNMFAMWNIGRSLETLLGASRFAVLYGLSALGGGAAMAMSPNQSLAAGASGAIFGLFGALCVLFGLKYRESRSEPERRQIRRTIAQLLLPNVVISLLPGISLLGHLGGFVVGVLAMIGIHGTYRSAIPVPAANRLFTVAALVLGAVVAAGIGSVWLQFEPWLPGA